MKKIISLILLLVIGSTLLLTSKNKGEVTNILSSPFSFDKYSFIKQETIKKEQPVATIEISKVNLLQKIYAKNSSLNNVDKNVTILTDFCLEEDSCLILLAAHSGSCEIAYFKNLDKLELQDEAILIYQNFKYIYELQKIEIKDKNGHLNLKKEKGNFLYLTTCDKKEDNKQDVYIFILKDTKST